jgi:hypothetical protein
MIDFCKNYEKTISQNLILDRNDILHIPKLHFGFEALLRISLKNNKIELPEDLYNLADLVSLENVIIAGNPVCLRSPYVSSIKEYFSEKHIEVLPEEISPIRPFEKKPMRTIRFDPLTLPMFTKEHMSALNKPPKVETAVKSDNVFMTEIGSQADEDAKPKTIEPTPLPPPPEEPLQTTVWSEVPVLQTELRKKLTTNKRNEYLTAFRRLEFIIANPELKITEKPGSTAQPPKTETPEKPPQIFEQKKPKEQKATTGAELAQRLAARTEYTKAEIQQILESMDERLTIVERDLLVTDSAGQNAIDIALDQQNFTNLHKLYESIRAELINTLNS